MSLSASLGPRIHPRVECGDSKEPPAGPRGSARGLAPGECQGMAAAGGG